MTTLQITLSTQLVTELSDPGANAYAVYFDSAGAAHWTTMVYNGTVSTGPYSVSLPSSYLGGKVYLLVQSVDAVGTANDLPTLITEQSQLNSNNASSLSFRYDSFEVSLNSQSGDVGNLTSVNGFGLPMNLSVGYSNGTSSSAGYGVSGASIVTDIQHINTANTYTSNYSQGPLSGQIRMATSPTEAVGSGSASAPFQASDWAGYVQSLETTTGTAINVAGFFNGAPDANGIYHNAGFYNYTVSWDSTNNVFWLSPNSNSQVKGYIKITPGDLENSIYSTLGNVEIYTNQTDAAPYEIYNSNSTEMNTGANNQWGVVLAQFLTGFTAGFYGVTGQALNSGITAGVNLNNNWNWDPTYAFGSHLAGTGAAPVFMDAYSEIFFHNSNSYGSGYSDALMQHYNQGGPLISMWDPGTNSDVATVSLTLYADGETPTGYTSPTINNYIPPASTGYALPTIQNGANIVLSFANQGMILDPNASITLNIMTGGTAANPTWTNVTLPSNATNPLFENWNLTYDSATQTYSAAPFAGGQPLGSLLINNLPVADSGVSWYQIVVSDNGLSKTFDLYTTTSGGMFLNPATAGQEASLAIDGLATISPPATSASTMNTFTLGFLYSTTTALDPGMLVANTSAAYLASLPTPSSPVIGTLVGEAFTAAAGQTALVSPAIGLTQGEVAFGWAGLNSANYPSGTIASYTNKLAALDVAQITFTGSSLAPMTATADIDGNWQTSSMTALGNGTYTAIVNEYLASDLQFATPVKPASSPVTFTVALTALTLSTTANGHGLDFVESAPAAVGGSWIQFGILGTPLAVGTTISLYATDLNGNLISRADQHTGSDVTLAEATLGQIGSVSSDAGANLLGQLSQTVYLSANEQLHFAVTTGTSTNTSPVVAISPVGDRESITIGGVTLTAAVNNTLSSSSELATAQHSSGEELVYLHKGDTLSVEVAGSAANTNTLGFVHVDVNAATGAWSVGGVAYGDTDAFHNAVYAALDQGFHEQHGGGQFDSTVTWHLAGGSGYYAPVLMTQSGDMFVVGNGNAGGYDYIRTYGENTFGFEDVAYNHGSDFDYNDMVMKLTLVPDHAAA